MPRLRINLRELEDAEDLVDELEEREGREEGSREEKRPINPLALQRRQEGRKFGKAVSRMLRERKSLKP